MSDIIDNHLRPPPVQWMRSAYAVEVNPWVKKGDVEAALFLRGVIVSAHGSIETRLSELCARFQMHDAPDGTYSPPYSLFSKIKYLRSRFLDSPFNHYQATSERFFERVLSGADVRHRLAHARMEITDIRWGVDFYDFNTPKNSPTEYRHLRLPLEEFEKEAWKAARLGRICQRLIGHFDSLALLPSINAAQSDHNETW